jgi:type IV pilus assembly protein PilB
MMEAAGLPTPLPVRERVDGRMRLGELLVHKGHLTPEQLQQALVEKEGTGRRLGDVLVENGWVSSEALARTLAEQHHIEFIDLKKSGLDESAAELLPERFARRYKALPVRMVDEDTALVAVADPTDVLTSDALRLALGLNVQLVVADSIDIDSALQRLYRVQVEVSEGESVEGADAGDDEELDIRESLAESAPAIKLVNSVISRAIEDNASDIHFQPQARHLVVRARIDGVTRQLTTIPKSMQSAVTTRLKIMGDLDIAERRVPQDGRVPIKFGGLSMDLRMAVLPSTYGEQVVIRILNGSTQRLSMNDLGMSPEAEAAFARAIRQPFGAVIACGPTGSGKTTTLYAALELLNDEERVLTTIEDPVENQFQGVTQVEVHTKAGLTFARGLRTILRSDPDVLLVGEIRDEETARIAVQAAMTGHLVLSTLHAHNAASSIMRLKDMSIEPNLLSTAVNCIISQRLARRLCLECREAYVAGEADMAALGLGEQAELGRLGLANEQITLYRAMGCVDCSSTGYSGRVALYEVMPIQAKVRRLIEASASTEEIFAAAVEQGMTSLRQDGIRQCLAGVSSLEEIQRITGDRFA